VTRASEQDRAELARWVALYKEVRGLLHTGTTVRADQHDESSAVHGVVAADRGDGLFAIVQLTTPLTAVPDRVRLPGLDPEATYEVTVQAPGDAPARRALADPPWFSGGVRLTGRALAVAGLRAPGLQPQQVLLLRTRRV